MTPAAHWSPAMGMAAIRRAHRAWANSQPQFVIPGLLDGLDGPSLTAADTGACEQEAGVRTGGTVEPAVPPSPAAGSTPRSCPDYAPGQGVGGKEVV